MPFLLVTCIIFTLLCLNRLEYGYEPTVTAYELMKYESTGEQNSINWKSSNVYSVNSLSVCGIGGEL